MKIIILLFILTLTIFSLFELPVSAAVYCCEQDDPGTCAYGIGPTRYYCYDSMAACSAGTCSAAF